MAPRKKKTEAAWAADAVERRDVASLIPAARNARIHSETQVAQIAASIKEFGWTVPVLVDESDGIIAGHGRVLAAHLLKIESVPVVVARGWSDAQKRAYMIADNQVALSSTWNLELLKSELQGLEEDGFAMDLLGFSDGELQNLFLDRQMGGNDADAEWDGMPEYENEDQEGFRIIKVHFVDEAAVRAFAKKLKIHVPEKANFVWYPEQPKADLKSMKYEAGDDGEASDD